MDTHEEEGAYCSECNSEVNDCAECGYDLSVDTGAQILCFHGSHYCSEECVAEREFSYNQAEARLQCDDCQDDLNYCDSCGRDFAANDEIICYDGNHYCNLECLMQGQDVKEAETITVTKCEKCGTITEDSDMEEMEGKLLCPTCYEELEDQAEGTEEKDFDKTTVIYLHTIEYHHFDYDGPMDDADKDHIKKCIEDGIHEGELDTGAEEHRGWWRIKRNDD